MALAQLLFHRMLLRHIALANEIVITYTAEGRIRRGALTVHISSGWDTAAECSQGFPDTQPLPQPAPSVV